VFAPELLERCRDGVDIDDLAVTDDPDRQVGAGGALEADNAVDRDLGGDDTAGLDVESDDGAAPGCGRLTRRRLASGLAKSES